MRGKQSDPQAIVQHLGITPADAGKTIFLYSFLSKNRDHPRGCGENRIMSSNLSRAPGSPPRMRGKPQKALKRHSRDRITPADAGKTPYRCSRHQADRDHPRGCGENTLREYHNVYKAGSPPRMRGKPGVR